MEETQIQLLEWLDDLCVRFIINLPNEELQSAERICFQIEEAQWFYEDFVRPTNPTLPSMNLRDFCLRIFAHCPLFSQYSPDVYLSAFSSFMTYKTRVPVRGAIMLDEKMEHVLLVKGWKKSASWSFPRGKINKDERDIDCAVREVLEETGYDIAGAGLIQEESEQKFIEVTMREQQIKLYVFRGVPTDTVFQPRTRKEISKIQWYKLVSLPGYKRKKNQNHANAQIHALNNVEDDSISASKLYMVAPFLVPLKQWISDQRRRDKLRSKTLIEDHAASGYDTAGNDLRGAVSADQYGQYEAAAQMRTAEDPEQDVFTSLGFAQPVQAEPPTADAAGQLKRMLNLGVESQEPNGTPAMPQDEKSISLLSLLQRSPAHGQAQPSQQPSFGGPSLSSQQLTPQAQNNLFHLLQPPANKPPQPRDPFASIAQAMQQAPFAGNITQAHSQVPIQSSTHQQEMQRQSSSAIEGGQRPNVPPWSSLAKDPLQARPLQQDVGLSPVAPTTSKDTQPQLSNHARSLLDTLRIKDTGASESPVPARTSSIEQRPEPKSSRKSSFAFVPASVAPSRRGSSQTKVVQSPSPASHTSASLPGPPSHSLPPATAWAGPQHAGSSERNQSKHQDALLNLFKPPLATVVKPLAPQGEPVELPTPIIASPTEVEDRSQQVSRDSKTSAPKPLTILQRPKAEPAPASPPRIGSSGNIEVRVPTGPKVRSPRASQRNKDNTRHAQLQQASPMQILKRPTEAPAPPPLSRAKTPMASNEPVELKGSTPKPFQPQILKRPQQPPVKAQGSGQAPVQAASTVLNENVGVEKESNQREALLSLFNTRKPLQAEASQVVADERDRTAQGAVNNSLAQLLAKQGPGSRKQSQDTGTATPRQTVAQTPISPSDRGFLMSYLDGLVKGAK